MKKKQQAIHNIAGAPFRMFIYIIISAMLLAGCSGPMQQIETETNGTYTEPSNLPQVEVSMDEYSFAYAGDRASIIAIEETEQGLAFFVELDVGKAPMFTLVYNSQEGDIVTVLMSESGERVPVSIMMFAMPDNLSEKDQQRYALAQESVNEIVDSIKLK